VELSAAQVKGHFQQRLLALGFQSEAVSDSVGQQSIRLSRGTDTVTVAITTTGTGSTRFTLLGSLHA
jgi:DNA-binding MurR/RpiR family transcriptional regulator